MTKITMLIIALFSMGQPIVPSKIKNIISNTTSIFTTPNPASFNAQRRRTIRRTRRVARPTSRPRQNNQSTGRGFLGGMLAGTFLGSLLGGGHGYGGGFGGGGFFFLILIGFYLFSKFKRPSPNNDHYYHNDRYNNQDDYDDYEEVIEEEIIEEIYEDGILVEKRVLDENGNVKQIIDTTTDKHRK